jgi:hypothetical protein
VSRKEWAIATARPAARGRRAGERLQWRDLLGEFAGVPNSVRQFCKKCGGHIMTDHPEWGVTDVFAATIPSLAFVPGVHVNYAETVLLMRDGLPKFKEFPAEIGGSGEQVPE